MTIDKALLFKPRLPEADVEIEDVGTVRVRGLSRAEVLETNSGDTATRERRILAVGMVDPPLTEDEAQQWQSSSPASEIGPVVDRIVELSGLKATSSKDAFKSV